jgi:hypothetical protein
MEGDMDEKLEEPLTDAEVKAMLSAKYFDSYSWESADGRL